MRRIETLEKKEQVLKDNFEKKGLNIHLSDIKIRIKEFDTGSNLYEKLISAFKRKKEKEYFDESTTVEDRLTFLQDVSFGSYHMKIEKLWDNEEDMTSTEREFAIYMTELLKSCAELGNKVSLETVKTDYIPVRIYYTQQGFTHEGFSLLNTRFKKKYHNKDWRLTRQTSRLHLTVYDIPTLFTDTLIHNSLEQFVLKDPELIRYLVAKEVARSSYIPKIKGEDLITPLPTEEPFRSDLLNTIKKYGIKIGKPLDNAFTNSFSSFYYLKRNEHGYIGGLKHHLMLNLLMPEFFEQMEYVVEKTEKEMRQRSDYARSYETKKQINKEVLKVMKNNAFLKRYKYVELDNKVVLSDFRDIEKEFLYLLTLIPIPEAFDHSFRVKRLGHHKAEGVYFPGAKATIISVKFPRAYIHELGHQIDYNHLKTGELLSEQVDFRGIIDAYKEYSEQNVENLPDNDPFKLVWYGNSKYNRRYYFDNTEVFARSLELYLHTQGVKTSFLRESYDLPEYPKQERFITLITAYFDNFFGDQRPSKVLKEKEKEKEIKKAKEEKEKKEKEMSKTKKEEDSSITVPTEQPSKEVKEETKFIKEPQPSLEVPIASSVQTEETKTIRTGKGKQKRKKTKKVDPNQLSIFDFM